MEAPIYAVKINEDEELGIEYISLVGDPAIGVNWVALKNKKTIHLQADQQLLIAPVIIPGQKILRLDEQGNPFYITFSKEVIKEIRDKYFAEGKLSKINIEHSDVVEGHHVVESWIIEDTTHDKSAVYGFELPVGTLMLAVKINDAELWNKKIKSGDLRGFSLEGNFELNLEPANKVNLSNNIDMSIINQVNKQLAKLTSLIEGKPLKKGIKLASQVLEVKAPAGLKIDGTLVGGTELRVLVNGEGKAFTQDKATLKLSDLPAGEYVIAPGRTLIITEDSSASVQEVQMATYALADSRTIFVNHETQEVWLVSESGEYTQLEDGEYATMDGKILVVANGYLVEVKEMEEVMAEAEVPAAASIPTQPEGQQAAADFVKLSSQMAKTLKDLSRRQTQNEEVLTKMIALSEKQTIENQALKEALTQAQEELAQVKTVLERRTGATFVSTQSNNTHTGSIKMSKEQAAVSQLIDIQKRLGLIKQ